MVVPYVTTVVLSHYSDPLSHQSALTCFHYALPSYHSALLDHHKFFGVNGVVSYLITVLYFLITVSHSPIKLVPFSIAVNVPFSFKAPHPPITVLHCLIMVDPCYVMVVSSPASFVLSSVTVL